MTASLHRDPYVLQRRRCVDKDEAAEAGTACLLLPESSLDGDKHRLQWEQLSGDIERADTCLPHRHLTVPDR